MLILPAQGFFLKITPVAPEVRASLSLPRESDKERPGSPPGPRAGRKSCRGGLRPGPELDSPSVPGLRSPWAGAFSLRRWARAGGVSPARPLFAAESGLTFPPWLGWLLPREAGLRRQGRHPCKANT